jgi:hypothetical protein
MSDEAEAMLSISKIGVGPYMRCPACRRVVLDPDRKVAVHGEPAPCCGGKGEGGLVWPSVEIHDVIDIAKKQKLRTPRGRRVAIVFLASALEMLLEDVLWELLEVHGSSNSLSKLVLDGYHGRDRRVGVFKTLAGKSVSEVLRAKHLDSFDEDWKAITKARNGIVHKYTYERGDDQQAQIQRVIDRCFEAFEELNNYAVAPKVKPK